jgi:CubicO group peptidase (beta-lactamase class C family)
VVNRVVAAFVISIPAVVGFRSAAAELNSTPRFPGAAWESRAPAELGLDGAKLDEIEALLGGDGCVVYDGYMVKQWGQNGVREDWASASKPVIATMLMFAVHEGLIDSVDEPIDETGWPLIPKDHPITYRSLANMVSGYTREEVPEEAWAYNDYGIQLLVETLFDQVYRASPDDAATDPDRLGALQLEDGGVFGPEGNDRVVASVRDFARIAWFWLHRGAWNDVQLLPRAFFDAYRIPQVSGVLPVTEGPHPMDDYLGVGTYGGDSNQTPYGPGIYGFGWWFNGYGPAHPDSHTWPDAPIDTFQANGHWGLEVVNVIPSHRIVLLHRDSNAGFAPGSVSSLQNTVLRLLAEAVRPRPFLTLGKTAEDVVLDWTDDCGSDHAIYEGTLGDWYSHVPAACSDGESDRTERLPIPAGDRYYLVVPRDGTVEGSYGRDSYGGQRPVSLSACVAEKQLGFCPAA